MLITRMCWCPGLLLLQLLCGIALNHGGNAAEIEKSDRLEDTEENPAFSSVATISELVESSFYTTYSLSDEFSISSTTANLAPVEEQETSDVNYPAKTEKTLASLPNIEIDGLDSYLFKTISISPENEFFGTTSLTSSFFSSSATLNVDSLYHQTDSALPNHSSLLSQVPLTSPSVPQGTNSSPSFLSQHTVTATDPFPTRSLVSSISEEGEQSEEMTEEAAENSQIVFFTQHDFLLDTPTDYNTDVSLTSNRKADRSLKDAVVLLNPSEKISTSQNPLEIQSSFAISSIHSNRPSSIPKTARELLVTETPKLSSRKHRRPQHTESSGGDQITYFSTIVSSPTVDSEYMSSIYMSPQKHIDSTSLDLMTEAFGRGDSVSSPSVDFFEGSSQSNPQDDISLEGESSTETGEQNYGSDASEELNSHIQNAYIFSSDVDHQNIFHRRNGFIFIEPETETEPDIQLEGSLEDSGKNMGTHSNLQFSSTAVLQESFTSFPTFSSSQIEAAPEHLLEPEVNLSPPDTMDRRSDSGDETLNFRHSNLHSKPTFMHVKRLSAQNKMRFGKPDPYKSDFLIVVSPSSQRSSKEFELSTDEASPALNEDEVSQIVSILTANFGDTSTEDVPSSKSVLHGDVSESAITKNKTSRNDSPQFDDIISGIIQLLAGDVQVVRPPPNFQLAHPPVPRPPRPTSSRINNRGPPTLFPPTKTVVVFSQPPHHLNIRPRPPAPAPPPPVRPRPSSTRTNHFQTVPVVTRLVNVLPSRPDRPGAPTSSVVHVYKPLLNPMEGESYGSLPVGEGSVISVLKTIPVVSVTAAKSNTNSLPDGLIESTKKTSIPAEIPVRVSKDKSGQVSSQNSPLSSLTTTTEDSSAPLVYDDYYYDLSESEESKEDTVTNTNSSTFEILQDPPTESVNKPPGTKSTNSNISPYSSTQEKSQAVLISNPSSSVFTTLSSDKSSGDKYLYVSTKLLQKGSHVPTGPITDWVPFLEPPASNTGSVKAGHTKSAKVPEIVIITEPTLFDLTVTKALTGVLSPLSTSNSSHIIQIKPSESVRIQHTRLTNVIDSEVTSLSSSNLFMTSVASTHPAVSSTVVDKTIHPSVRMKPSPTLRQPHQTASLSPSEPEVVYGRPSSQDRPMSPLRVDNLSKYRHNSYPSDTFSKTQSSLSETFSADKDTTTLLGKASVKPKSTPPPVNSTSTSSVSSSSHQTQHNTGGSPLLGRPIVVPVDIEEVRPFVGAINPPRQGSRPNLNPGQRPPPGFPGPPVLGSGNVQVAQAGVNVAEDTRGRPSGLRPSQTSRPPLIRTPPRLRTNTPLVRIDTCIVGDDSTCDLQMNETCKTEHGVSSCQCRPGFSRSFARGPCQPIVSVMLSLKVDRFGDQRVSFNPRYQDPNSEEYRLMEFEAKQALSSMFAYTAFSRNFVSATVNKFYSIGGRLIINATIQLEEKESTRVPSLRLQMRQEVVQAINSRAQNIGDSRLYVEGPLNPVPAIEDVNECTESNLNDCSENGYCQNVFGTYLCKCKVGYLDSHPYDERKSGRKCSACSVDYCSNHGHCYVENGQKLCRCRGNYIGSRCEIDSEVLGVALGASLAAIIIIVLTLVCLCVWNRRWKREQQKTEAMSARSVNSAQTYSYLNKMSNLNTYRLTMEDRMRWAHIADVVGNVYVQPEAGATPMQTAMVQANQSAYPTMNRCHSPSSDETTWYSYNTTRPRSRAANCHSQSPVNGSYYDTDFSTRETYVGPGYAPVSRFGTPNVMRNYYS